MQYRPEIDGLRAIAVIAVLLFHAKYALFSGGYVGVDVFFVISGYLITSIILKEKQAGRFSLMQFYERRARRILPALFFIILCCVPIFGFFMLPGELIEFGKSILSVLGFVSNLFFWQTVDYFEVNADNIPLLHTWTLSVEEQFYIFFPLFIIACWALKTRSIVALIILLTITSFALSEYSWRHFPTANYYLPVTRAWELMLGCLCAFYLQKNSVKSSQIGSVVGLFCVILSILLYTEDTPFPSLYALLPTLGTVLLILTTTPQTFVGQILSHRYLVGLGLISYSLYLWHQPLFSLAHLEGFFTPFNALALCMLSVILAWLSWRFIEGPFRKKGTLNLKNFMVVIISMGTLLALFSIAAVKTDGFINRFSEEDQTLAAHSTPKIKKYLHQNYAQHLINDFPLNEKPNTLIIGDSFAKDLINMFHESGQAANVNIAAFHISHKCDNLLINRVYETNIHPNSRQFCADQQWYGNVRLNRLIQKADTVWLASAWTPAQAALLPESLKNIQALTPAKVKILGPKNFGDIHVRDYLKIPFIERANLKNSPSDTHLKTNKMMKDTLPQENFVNLQSMLCETIDACPIFTTNNALISIDGSHLTKAGAAHVGKRLF